MIIFWLFTLIQILPVTIGRNPIRTKKCTSQSGAKHFLINDHDQANNAVKSIKCSCDHRIFGKDVEKVITNIERFCYVLETFEVGKEPQSRYDNNH